MVYAPTFLSGVFITLDCLISPLSFFSISFSALGRIPDLPSLYFSYNFIINVCEYTENLKIIMQRSLNIITHHACKLNDVVCFTHLLFI